MAISDSLHRRPDSVFDHIRRTHQRPGTRVHETEGTRPHTEIEKMRLLTKLNKDPLKIHSKPYYLNYIYTIEEYRRSGNAYELLLYIKKFEEMSLLCSDDISQQLFKKAEFVFNSYEPLYNSFPIYRFP